MPVYNRVEAQIRSILKGTDYLQVNVDSLAEDADLYAAGLNSHATVNLMLSLEEAFDIELPDRLLRRRTFSSIRSIADALAEVGIKAEAA
jgi:acyl carrier protein